jgi:AraC-like DNA-binding protein
MPKSIDSHPPLLTFGLREFYGTPALMPEFHRHNDIELNFIERGGLTYLLRGQSVSLGAGQFGIFWAAVPHRVTHIVENTIMVWVTLPLALFLRMRLPEPLTRAVFAGDLCTDAGLDRVALDTLAFQQWQRDFNRTEPESDAIALMEIEARLRRLALAVRAAPPVVGSAAAASPIALGKVDQMVQFMAAHFQEPIHARDVAAAVGLHPTYAAALFSAYHGQTLIDCLTQYRITHAQRLLITTDLRIADIALESGFSTMSRFYTAFEQICGKPPRVYREALRRADTKQEA